MGAAVSCTCDSCVACCEKLPGWLIPSDIRRLAWFQGLDDPRQLFDTILAWDYWCGNFDDQGGEGDIWVPIPINASVGPGEVMSWGAPMRGESSCQLLVERRCSIHEAKPFECRDSYGSCRPGPHGWRRRRIARAWNRPAARRFTAYLRRGEETEPNIDETIDALDLLLGRL